MPELRTYEHHEFPPDLSWQAVSFVRVEWPYVDGGMVREMYGAALRPVHFALVEDGLLLSYAAVIRLRLPHAGEEYEARGLGSVFTYPASRGKGYGGKVVRAATDHIRASGADVAALFTGPELERFYGASGWEAQPGAVTRTGDRDKPEELDASRMMLFLSDKGEAGRAAFGAEPLYVEHGW